MRYIFAAFLVVGLFIVPWIGLSFPDQSAALARYLREAGSQLAAVILSHDPVSVDELKTGYAWAGVPGYPKVRILVVPGHEPDYGGAEFADVKERELNVAVADSLAEFLRSDPRFDVYETRTDSGWNPTFKDYFTADWDDIISWTMAHKAEIERLTRIGEFTPKAASVYHNDVPGPVAARLYGIGKWADENKMDIVIHVHFNDYPGHGGRAGDYRGFAIYVPERQYYNSSTTKALADAVFKRLARYNPVSNLPGEREGIVEDQDLIAVGSFNTVDAASMLIEYSYIYEPQVMNEDVRPIFEKELAYETYLGVVDFFDPARSQALARAYDTLSLPYYWQQPIEGWGAEPLDVFALQTALMVHGDYPPRGETLSDCPRTGRIGGCTKKAVEAFKHAYSLDDSELVGSSTLAKLNQLFSSDVSIAPRDL